MCATCDDGVSYCFSAVCVVMRLSREAVKYDVSCLATSWLVILCRFSHGVRELGILSSTRSALCWRVGGRSSSRASRQVKPLTWCHSNDLLNYKYSIWWDYKLLFDARLLLKYFLGHCCPHVQNNAAKVPLWKIKHDKVPSVGYNCVTTYRSLTLFWGL